MDHRSPHACPPKHPKSDRRSEPQLKNTAHAFDAGREIFPAGFLLESDRGVDNDGNVTETRHMKEIEASQFEAQVLHSESPVLVDFFGEKCSPCVHILPLLAEVEAERGAALKVVKVNANTEAALAASYRILSVPTLMIFRNGECIAQRAGAPAKKVLTQWIDEALKSTASAR